MIADRQQAGEKRLPFVVQFVEFRQRAIEEVFVRNAPSVDERRVDEIFLLEEAIETVGGHERLHAVEQASAGGHEQSVVAPIRQHMCQRVDVLRMIPFQNRLGWNRRQRRCHRFERPRRAVASREKVVEQQSLLRQLVETGGQPAIIAEHSDEVRTEALFQHDHDVPIAL